MAKPWSDDEHAFMSRALAVAERGRGKVSPNPLVGCVLVKDGEVIAEGWHDHQLSFQRGIRVNAPGDGELSCDGLLAPIPGELTFSINQANDAEGLCVSDEWVASAMRTAWQCLGIKLEPSGAVALGALLSQPELFHEQRVLVTLTGGNVDDRRFSECLTLAG